MGRLSLINAEDPTRTTVLRRDYARAMTRRVKLLRGAIAARLAAGFFGGGEEVLLELAAVDLFVGWLRDEADATLLEIDAAGQPSGWQRLFAEAAFLRGVAHADRLLTSAGYAARPLASGGVSLFEPAISRLAASNYDLLRNVSGDMVAAIRRELVAGVGQPFLPEGKVQTSLSFMASGLAVAALVLVCSPTVGMPVWMMGRGKGGGKAAMLATRVVPILFNTVRHRGGRERGNRGEERLWDANTHSHSQSHQKDMRI
jgi:hypothetical protein